MTAGTTLYSGLKIRIAAADTAMEIPTVAISVELSKPGLPSTGRMKPRCIRYENAAATSTPNGSAMRIGRLRLDTTQEAAWAPTVKNAAGARLRKRTAPQP